MYTQIPSAMLRVYIKTFIIRKQLRLKPSFINREWELIISAIACMEFCYNEKISYEA